MTFGPKPEMASTMRATVARLTGKLPSRRTSSSSMATMVTRSGAGLVTAQQRADIRHRRFDAVQEPHVAAQMHDAEPGAPKPRQQ